jgi:anti-anti-sigma factor
MAENYDFSCELYDHRLVVSGDCDLVTSKRLSEQIATYDGRSIELDLRGVTFFDSAALRVLLAAHERNPELWVGDVSQDVALVLKISGTYRRLRQPRSDTPSNERDVAPA